MRYLIFLLLAQTLSAQQVAKTITAGTIQIPALEYKPPGYTTSVKYPLIIFLHGIGERGTNPNVLAGGMLPKNLTGGTKFQFTGGGYTNSFIVLSPQIPTSVSFWPISYIWETVKYAKANLSIDTNRIYLTGLSLGGGGVWSAMNDASLSKVFAAISPVCGTCALNTAANITSNKIGVWASHAADDPTVPVGCTDGAIQMINQTNPQVPPIYTRYPGGGHGIWDIFYDTLNKPNVYEWFLSFKRGATPPPPISQDPVIVINPTKDTTIASTSITIDASQSLNICCGDDGYSWNIAPQAGGTWNYGLSPGGIYGRKKTLTNLTNGAYKIILTVRGLSGASATKTLLLTVSTTTPPIPPGKTVIAEFTVLVGGVATKYTLYSDKTWQ